jgi:hypothetical protein
MANRHFKKQRFPMPGNTLSFHLTCFGLISGQEFHFSYPPTRIFHQPLLRPAQPSVAAILENSATLCGKMALSEEVESMQRRAAHIRAVSR